MGDRPRRSTRQPTRVPVIRTEQSTSDDPPRPAKRKLAEAIDPQTQLRNILESPKSILTTMDISAKVPYQELLNANTWHLLSEDSHKSLAALLPSTAFLDKLSHASYSEPPSQNALESIDKSLNSNIFTDPHFLDAAHTFQDHLYSGWFTASHHVKLEKYIEGVRNGTLAVPWKDEVWERENPRPPGLPSPLNCTVPDATSTFGARTAGASADLKLPGLVRDNVLITGDIISYRRKFSGLGIVVEKDTIIQSIDPLTHALTVLLPKGTTGTLPTSLTCAQPEGPGTDIVSVAVSTPQTLETIILDTDGRVKKNQRPNGNAWKSFTVSRWRDNCTPNDKADPKGGRETYGTLFYLRGSHYYER